MKIGKIAVLILSGITQVGFCAVEGVPAVFHGISVGGVPGAGERLCLKGADKRPAQEMKGGPAMDVFSIMDNAEARTIKAKDFPSYKGVLEKLEDDVEVEREDLAYAYRVLGDNMSHLKAFSQAAIAYARAYELNNDDDDLATFLEYRLKVKGPYNAGNILKALQEHAAASAKKAADGPRG